MTELTESVRMTIHDVHVNIQMNLKAPKNQHNSFGNYAYRSKEDILEAVKPLANALGATVSCTDEMIMLGDRYYCKTFACLNYKGEQIGAVAYAREAENKKGMDVSQISGSCSSYAGKYALCNLFALDDSGQDPDSQDNRQDNRQAPRQNYGIAGSTEHAAYNHQQSYVDYSDPNIRGY